LGLRKGRLLALLPGKYIGIDGSDTPFASRIADLRTYRSKAEGILIRHVLEHNYDWEAILAGAVESFQKKLCLILFTPFAAEPENSPITGRSGSMRPIFRWRARTSRRISRGCHGD